MKYPINKVHSSIKLTSSNLKTVILFYKWHDYFLKHVIHTDFVSFTSVSAILWVHIPLLYSEAYDTITKSEKQTHTYCLSTSENNF
jgi:hypothetical protein